MQDRLTTIGRYDPALAETVGQGGDGDIAVIARLSESAQLGDKVRVITRFADIVTLRIDPENVAGLAESEAVLSLESPRKLRRMNTLEDTPIVAAPGATGAYQSAVEAPSMGESASAAYTRRPPGVSATGKGCVVGVIDWGCDFAFPAFRHADGTSRIEAMWDQRSTNEAEQENRWGYGRIFSANEINHALAHQDPYEELGYRPSDVGGEKGAHGTHVLDIAAGNGNGGGMSGVAPEASIIFVHLSRTTKVLSAGNLGDSASVLEALDFIFSVAGDRPCVVNMSVGAHGGPHDGSTLVEQGIDRAVALKSGRAVVNSAGNYFTGAAHFQGRLKTDEELLLPFIVPPGDPTGSELEVWYPGIDRITVSVLDPEGNQLAQVASGSYALLEGGEEVLGQVHHHIRPTTNGDHHIDLFMEPNAPSGIWHLRLHGDDISDGRFDAWIERDTGLRPRFLRSQAAGNSTTGTLCNGRLSITTGAYDPYDRNRKLASFSSSGPTRDGRIKPEIVAPGVRIRAACSAPAGEPPGARYVTKSGTSMAAPHVTGIIALMLEAAGIALDIYEIRALLFGAARRDVEKGRGRTRDDLHRFGYGYLDMTAAENAARQWGTSNMKELKLPDESGTEMIHEPVGESTARFEETDAPSVTYGTSQPIESPSTLRETLQQAFPDPSPSLDSAEFHRQVLTTMGVRPHDELRSVARSLDRLDAPIQPGDVMTRSAPSEGVLYSGIIVSERPEPAAELSLKGVPLESFRPGHYVEVLEVPLRGGQVRTMGRRLTDANGRVLRGQKIFRPSAAQEATKEGIWPDTVSLAASEAPSDQAWDETITVDDVAGEMNGLRCRFVQAFTARRGSDRRTFANGATLTIGAWNGSGADATIDGFAVPKLMITPHTDPAAGVRRYDLPLQAQRTAVQRNARELSDWLGREASYARNRSLWEREKTRLEDLLARRHRTYNRMWVRQMMYNRFDGDILHWTQHYNRTLRPGTALDPNIPKSIFYQESRMGTSGTHLMPPPSDWSSASAHPIRSRFNIGQAIDSFGPQQWLMMREMAPALFRRHGLDALENQARWQGMSNADYGRHPTYMRAMRQFFEHRSGGNNLMGTASKDLHEDYGFWIRTAIRWLFHKYQRLRSPSWAEAVRAYNGSGPAARQYRTAVMARVGGSSPYTAEQASDDVVHWPPLAAMDTDDSHAECGERSLLFDTCDDGISDELSEGAPRLDTSAELSWEDLTRVRDSRGARQVFYLVTGAPPRRARAGDEGKAVFRLRVRNTNSVYNHQDVATRTRLIDFGPRRTPRVVMGWTAPQRGPELEDESSRVIVLRLNPETLAGAYNSDSPLTRLEVEYHWRETFESRQRHYNRIGLDFMLVAPIEYLLSRSRRMHERDYELNDPDRYRDDFWIPVTGVDFTPEIQSPVTVQLDVSSSLTRQAGAGGSATARTSRSRTLTTTTSNTFSLQLSGEMSRGGSASANIEVFELGLERMFKLGASLGYSRTTTDTSSTTVAREFSRSLTWSRSYSTSQAVMTRTTLEISPPTLRGPSGTGRTGTPIVARGGSVGVYLYPTVAFFEVPFVRFTPANGLGQATRRESGTVAVPHITGWRLTAQAGA